MTRAADDNPNEILLAAREAQARAAGAKHRTWPIAVGVGSAALAAALLYARVRRDD